MWGFVFKTKLEKLDELLEFKFAKEIIMLDLIRG